ncbi:MAG: BLUF domain-containing protein [Fimbriimonadaceae bacterium]
MDLSHLIYVSASTQEKLEFKDIEKLLHGCRTSNAKADVTGMLIFRDGAFFQVLEGDRSVLEALFEKIGRDARHRRVIKLIAEPIPERNFSDWSMALSRLSSAELAKIPGLKGFFANGSSLLEIGEGRAKDLLAAFSEGRWRASLT